MRRITALIAAAGIVGIAACSVEQTDEGELPEVDVNATGGDLPAYDVDAADVNVGTTEETVEVPTIDIDESENQ